MEKRTNQNQEEQITTIDPDDNYFQDFEQNYYQDIDETFYEVFKWEKIPPYEWGSNM